MKLIRLIFLFIIFLLPFTSHALVCDESLAELPVQTGGRIKPLGVHAREEIRFIHGKTPEGGALTAYCNISQLFLSGKMPELKLRVEHADTKKFLGIDDRETHIDFIFFNEHRQKISEQATAYRTRKDKSAAARDLITLNQRGEMLERIAYGQDWTVPMVNPHGDASATVDGWTTLAELNSSLVQAGLIKGSTPEEIADSLIKYVRTLGDLYRVKIDSGYLLELKYVTWHPFGIAIIFALISLIVISVTRKPLGILVWVSLVPVLAVQVVGVTMRVIISGRGPVTNMYETVMWVGLGSLLFAVLLAVMRREKIYLLGGLFLNICCLFMMEFATGMLDPSIRPLVPVLRDNFWLSTHVTSITISYAALALSWILANGYMVGSILKKMPDETADRLSDLSYSAIKIGVVLLALGIILGGIWADYSWGRFWGWDPKETWALIALLGYIAILHGRYTGWISSRLFLPLIALAFLGVLMAWFGVNYILASGLHSYGFSEGGSIFLASIFSIQIAIVILHYLRWVLSQRMNTK